MSALFKNLQQMSLAAFLSITVLVLLPIGGSFTGIAQATPSASPCPGDIEVEVSSITWISGTTKIDYAILTSVDIGGASGANVTVYEVKTDNTNGNIGEATYFLTDDTVSTFHLGLDYGAAGQSLNPVKFRVVVKRSNCADMVETFSFPKPTTGAGSLAFADIDDVIVEDSGNDDILKFDPVVRYDAEEHDDLEYEFRYRDDNTPWENISPVTPSNDSSDYEIADFGEPIMSRDRVEITVDSADHGDHQVLVRIIDTGNNDEEHFETVVTFD